MCCVDKEKQLNPHPHSNNTKGGLKSVCGKRHEQVGDAVQKAVEDRAEAEGRVAYKVRDKIHIVWKRKPLRKKSWAMKDHPVFCACV